MEDGNHRLDCHRSFDFHHNAILHTKISGFRVNPSFDRTSFDNGFSTPNGVCGSTYFDEII